MEERQSHKKAWIALGVVLGLLVVGGGAYKFYEAEKYKCSLQNQYNRAFYEMTESLQDIEVSLEKGMLISNPKQMVNLSNEINRKAEAAKANLGQLPIQDVSLDQTSKFLTQVGDYTYSLAMKVLDDETPTQEEYDNISQLIQYSKTLNESLSNMEAQLFDGKATIGKMQAVAAGDDKVGIDLGLAEIEEQFVDYPALIYDGPFSSHIEGMEAQMLKDRAEVSLEEAKEIARSFLGDRVQLIESNGEKGGNMPAYSFTGYADPRKKEAGINIDISKQGGQVIWMLDNRAVGTGNLDVNQAKQKAVQFLDQKGFTNMKDSYYEVQNNVATINYAYSKDGIVMYPDLIKVKIAMDNGECIGIETKGYLMNHKNRKLPEPALTKEDAKARVNPNLTINAVELAVIPTDSKSEIYCYEIKGVSGERNFIIYINAMTGAEEKILLLMESESGVLSM